MFKFNKPSLGISGISPLVPINPIVGLMLFTPQKDAGILKLPLKSPPILEIINKNYANGTIPIDTAAHEPPKFIKIYLT